MKKPQSSVKYSVIAPGARSPSGFLAVILAPAPNRLKARALRLQHRLQRAEDAIRLVAVVGGAVADVDADRDKARARPRMNREARFREKDRAGDALGRELEESVADDRESGFLNGLPTNATPGAR